MAISRFASALGLAVGLTACSYQWTASVEVRQVLDKQHAPLTVELTNSFGVRFSVKLDNCVDVHIGQHPKLPNRIKIALIDVDGKLVGSALRSGQGVS